MFMSVLFSKKVRNLFRNPYKSIITLSIFTLFLAYEFITKEHQAVISLLILVFGWRSLAEWLV